MIHFIGTSLQPWSAAELPSADLVIVSKFEDLQLSCLMLAATGAAGNEHRDTCLIYEQWGGIRKWNKDRVRSLEDKIQ